MVFQNIFDNDYNHSVFPTKLDKLNGIVRLLNGIVR